jgi:hypothetical protein
MWSLFFSSIKAATVAWQPARGMVLPHQRSRQLLKVAQVRVWQS